MDRRLFMVLGTCALAMPLIAEGQQVGKIPRIGLLVIGPRPGESGCVSALRHGLADLGYVEGRSHEFDMRWTGESSPETTLPRLSGELVGLGVDVIVFTSSQGLEQSKQALAEVPVVMATSNFPVERGLIASLARPGGNITGIATFTPGMFAKRVQLLAEALPGLSRVALFRVPGAQNDLVVRDLDAGARQMGVKLQVMEVRRPDDFPGAFQAAVRGGAQAIMTAQSPFFYQHRRLTADLAMKYKLPSFSGELGAAAAGILMSTGPSIPASCQRAAYFVDRILKGAKPADLPVEQTTKFDLEINLKTAKALGLTIPPSVLARADEVIQ